MNAFLTCWPERRRRKNTLKDGGKYLITLESNFTDAFSVNNATEIDLTPGSCWMWASMPVNENGPYGLQQQPNRAKTTNLPHRRHMSCWKRTEKRPPLPGRGVLGLLFLIVSVLFDLDNKMYKHYLFMVPAFWPRQWRRIWDPKSPWSGWHERVVDWPPTGNHPSVDASHWGRPSDGSSL